MKTAAPLLFLGWAVLVFSGRANDLLFGDGPGPDRFLVLVGGIAVIALVSAVLTAVAAKRRRTAFTRLAAERGWRYQATDTRDLPRRWSWEPFGQGSSRRASDVLHGEHAGYRFAAFHYRYVTGSGDDRRTHLIGVIALRLPAALPRIEVSPEGLIGSIAPGLVRTDIDLESEDFNRRYRVSCADRKFAVDILTPRTVEALLSVRPFRWRIDGSDLIAIDAATESPAAVLDRVAVLAGVAAGIPSFVWKDRGRSA